MKSPFIRLLLIFTLLERVSLTQIPVFYKSKRWIGWLSIGSFLVLITNPAVGQERKEIRDSLYSSLLKETRMIEVLLPKSYRVGSAEKYGVVYKLDGEWDTWLLPGSYDFAVGAGFVPENIFVRIPNTYKNGVNLRDRDLTPSQVKEYSQLNELPISGGADNFRAFLREELIPYINKNYPSNGENTLVGGSLAGLFTIYTFLKDAHLFNSYVAVEPAMHWDNKYVNKLLTQELDNLSLLENTTLWIAGREGRPYEYMGIAQLDSILQKKAPKGLLWKSAAYPNETHYSAQYKGYYDGFKFIYSGYVNTIEYHPMNGILLKDQPITLVINTDTSALHYTTNGTIPTASSAKLTYSLPLSAPTQLRIQSFGHRSDYNKTISGHFIAGKVLAGRGKLKEGIAQGLHYSIFEGDWETLPDYKQLTPVQSGKIQNKLEIKPFNQKTNHAFLIEGNMEVSTEGYYFFIIDSAHEVKVYVGNQLIIDGNGEKSNSKLSYVLPLGKGLHPLRVEVLQKKSGNKPNFKIYHQKKLQKKREWWENEYLSF